MKKIISALLAVMFVILCLSSLTACGKKPKSPDNTNGPNNNIPLDFNIGYIGSLMADISDATGLGIKKSNTPQTAQINYTSNKAPVAPLGNGNGQGENNNNQGAAPEEKNYLYKTTEDFDVGFIEYDETGITKVTFKKNTNVTEEVSDSEGNLIDNNTTITQDEIPAQINKFLVSYGYTFIQFIPVVSESGNYYYLDNNSEPQTVYVEVRPADSELQVDNKGIFEFDKRGYYSDALHQSFVVDNGTGFIYKIENFYITEIHNGLIKSSDNFIYDMRITENGELEFFSILENTALQIKDYYKDIYGNNYIENNHIDTFVASTNTLYFKIQEDIGGVGHEFYRLSNEGVVVNVQLDRQGSPGMPFINSIKKISSKLDSISISEQWIDIDTNDNLTFNNFLIGRDWRAVDYSISKLVNNYIYVLSNNYYYNVNSYSVYNDPVFIKFITNEQEPSHYGTPTLKREVISRLIYHSNSKELIYTNLSENNSETLLTGYELISVRSSYWNFDANKFIGIFEKMELSGLVRYIVVFDNEGNASIVKESEYIADSQKIITLQPINR